MKWYEIIFVIIAVIGLVALVSRIAWIIYNANKEKRLNAKKMANRNIYEKQNEDFEWFVQHYDEFYKKYGECYLVIHDKGIIGVCDTYKDGIEHAKANGYQLGEFIVQHCNGDESGYTAYVY